jgi:hypothetical protein
LDIVILHDAWGAELSRIRSARGALLRSAKNQT